MEKTVITLNARPIDTLDDVKKAQDALAELMQSVSDPDEMHASINDIGTALKFLKDIESQLLKNLLKPLK